MCGICGFISRDNVSVQQLKAMNDKMIYRGPDDSGEVIFTSENGCSVGLAHRRLSIIDLSGNGHQPFYSADKNVVVVFNGEIYNFARLKKELDDYNFVSTCDTEVIIAAYQKWGHDFINHIDGMFAIALYDKTEDCLLMVRDRIGKKPLYYYHDGTRLVFASNLKVIMEYPGLKLEINKDAIPGFLRNGYITGEKSIFRNTYRVTPGQMVVFKDNKIKKTVYFDFIEEYQKAKSERFTDYQSAKSEIKKQLIRSVQDRMVADVPVGMFLSGGFDSALVTAVAQSQSNLPVKTFSIGFEEKAYDEAPFAKAIAEHLGTEHTNHYVTKDEMLELVASIPEYYDEPFADSSQIPSMLVAKIAKEDVSVVLTGDGGDELFCGYMMYDKLESAQKLEPVSKVIRLFVRKNGRLLNKMPFKIKSILLNSDERFRTQLGLNYYEDCISKICNSSIEPKYDESYIPEKKWQIRRMLLDSTTYLPDNNLCKVDRATMRYSLEARNPLLDVSVVRTALRTPQNFKYYKKDKKHILKDLTYDYIPRELMDRPKMGFATPIDTWLRDPLKSDVQRLTSEAYLRKQGLFSVEFTHKLVEKYLSEGNQGSFSGNNLSNVVWPLYMFQKWYEYYIEK